MRIGELSRRTGASVRSIRHYEASGLLASDRSRNGYRDFDEAAVERVALVRALLAQGFGVRDTRVLLACIAPTGRVVRPCPAVLDRYARKLRELDERIGALVAIRDRTRVGLMALRRRTG